MKVLIDIPLMNSYKLTPNLYVMLFFKYFKHPSIMSPDTKVSLIKLGFMDEACNLTSKCNALFKKDLASLKDEEIIVFLLELRKLFPKGVKIANSPVRSAVGMATVRKLKRVVKEYGFDEELIINATKAYVAAKKKDNYGYMMKFSNFIDKQNVGSELATYCFMILDGDDKIKTDGRIERTL